MESFENRDNMPVQKVEIKPQQPVPRKSTILSSQQPVHRGSTIQSSEHPEPLGILKNEQIGMTIITIEIDLSLSV